MNSSHNTTQSPYSYDIPTLPEYDCPQLAALFASEDPEPIFSSQMDTNPNVAIEHSVELSIAESEDSDNNDENNSLIKLTNNNGRFNIKHMMSTQCTANKPVTHHVNWLDTDTEGTVVISKIVLGAKYQSFPFPNDQLHLVTIKIAQRKCPHSEVEVGANPDDIKTEKYHVFPILANISFFPLFRNEFIELCLKIEAEFSVSKLVFSVCDIRMVDQLDKIFSCPDIVKFERIEEIQISVMNDTCDQLDDRVRSTWNNYNDSRTSISPSRIREICSLISFQLNNSWVQMTLDSVFDNSQQSLNNKVQNGMIFCDEEQRLDSSQENFLPTKSIIVTSVVVLNKQLTHVVLTKEIREPHTYKLYLPAGKQKGNESITDCAIREAMEEIGVKLNSLTLLNVEDNGTKMMRFNFFAIIGDGSLLKSHPDQHSVMAEWYPVNHIFELIECFKNGSLLNCQQKLRAQAFRYCDFFELVELAHHICSTNSPRFLDVETKFSNNVSYRFNSVRLGIVVSTDKDGLYILAATDSPNLLPELVIPESSNGIPEYIADFIRRTLDLSDPHYSSLPIPTQIKVRIAGIHHGVENGFNGIRFDVVCGFSAKYLPDIRIEPYPHMKSNNYVWLPINKSPKDVFTYEAVTDQTVAGAYFQNKPKYNVVDLSEF